DFVLYGELLREFDRLGCKPALIQFAQSLSSNELLTTLNIANEFLDTASIYPVDTVKKCMIPFLTTLVKQIKESGHTSGSMSSAAIKEFAAMKTINSMGSLEKWFLDIIDQSLELINNRKESFHLLVRRTLDIIRKDYNHTDLSLKRIASNLKVTPAYLGQLFKEETGKYFNDYLTEIRLQESRILLLETDLKIRDILYCIGISNQSYFNRIFKKAYGMSPLDFRYQK
ncbi:MAG: helix-turn-helix domain-containing protein, partial [Clostridia bacterium]|nr:helix-turn-helix domain-containing protein [Clostridia bacterium]